MTMLLFAGLLLRVLALGTQVVPADGLKFNFTDVRQCDQVIISFAGTNISTVPTSLAILPINSTAVVIPLRTPSVLSTGISLNFLPLPAGSNFLASLDDGTGDNLIPISDLIRVLPSTTGDSSCVTAPTNNVRRRFTLTSQVSQCEEITINYDTAVAPKAPSVRLYNPKGVSFPLNMTSDDPVTGTATYTMNFPRGKEIMLLMEDGSAIKETSPLITVGGDASSDISCFARSASGTNSTSTATGSGNKVNKATTSDALADTGSLSKAVIIGSAIGGSAVFFIAVCMLIFIVQDRRKRRKSEENRFDPSQMEKGPDNEKASPNVGVFVRPPSEEGIPNPFAMERDNDTISNPLYTSNSFLSPTKSTIDRGSMASWAQVIPEDQRYPGNAVSPSRVMVRSPQSASRLSLQSLDIEGMLNMATLQSENYSGSRKNSDAMILARALPSPSLGVPTSTFLRPERNRRHRRSPSDLPVGPDSMAFSRYSVIVNPFDTRESVTGGFIPEPLRTGESFRISNGSDGLPLSPRDLGSPTRGRNIAGTRRSSADWYGIAR